MVKVKFNSNIQYKWIDDCESGLSLASDQQQESDTQEEQSGGEQPSRDIDKVSSNNSESLSIEIDGLDQIEDSYTDDSDEDQQNDTYGEQSFNEHKIRGEDSNTWIVIIILFFFICSVTIIADNFGVHPERPIYRTYALMGFGFSSFLGIMILLLKYYL